MIKSNFFDTNSFFIDEKVNLFQFENCYQIYNENAENIGVIKQKLSTSHKLLSLLISKKNLPFFLEIRNANDGLEATISRDWTFILSKVTVSDSNGMRVGTIKQKFKFFSSNFKIYDANETLIADMQGNWTAWNFVIKDASNNQIGTISKKWAGAMKELFTTADKYNVSIEPTYANLVRKMIILAGAITVDMVLKEAK